MLTIFIKSHRTKVAPFKRKLTASRSRESTVPGPLAVNEAFILQSFHSKRRGNMTKLIHSLIASIILLQTACGTPSQQTDYQQAKAERKPFQRSSYVIRQPEKQTSRELENGKLSRQKERVVVVDEKAGKYEFRWIGSDGKEKIVAYQRHDAIDAIVEASVDHSPDRNGVYKYRIRMLQTSPTYFRIFLVQTKASDAQPDKRQLDNSKFMVGKQSNANPLFEDGVWWNYGFIGSMEERFWGGESVEFQLSSKNPPGIVNYKAVGGEITTKGVGEEIPMVLENQIPIFEDMAWGYTIGPVEKLSGMSKPERAEYLLESLPKFQEAGWMSEGTAKNYEAILKREDLSGALMKAKKDLENEFITNEVFQIIEGLNQ